jgi:hypothetical protein
MHKEIYTLELLEATPQGQIITCYDLTYGWKEKYTYFKYTDGGWMRIIRGLIAHPSKDVFKRYDRIVEGYISE